MQGCFDGFRLAVEYLQAGGIGDVSEIHVWTNQPSGSQDQLHDWREKLLFGEINWDGFIGPSFSETTIHATSHTSGEVEDFGSVNGDSGMHL